MTAHELARLLLDGPDLLVELETESDIEDLYGIKVSPVTNSSSVITLMGTEA